METRHVEINDTFTFESDSVAKGFGHHVREQLPWYDLVTSAIVQIGRHYIPHGGVVYDIGAADGNIGRALAETLDDRGAYLTAVEPSPQMCNRYDGPGTVVCRAAEDTAYEPYDLAIAMLTLMFVPPSRVGDLLTELRAKVKPGGALIVVERFLPPRGYPSIITSRLTLAAKLQAGATAEEIIAKELSLAGVQRPLGPEILGPDAVEWFRFGDFAGYLIQGQS